MGHTTAENIKILILYARYGEGHKRAAQAIEETLLEQMPNAEIVSEDFLGEAFPVSDWVMRKLYLQTFHWAKSIYGYLYYKTKEFSADASLFQFLSYLGIWKLENYLQKHQPTLVISTFPSLTGMLAKVKERSSVSFQLWCVLTDYVAHSQWLYKSVDSYFVPAEKIKSELISMGIDSSSIVPTGIPVASAFHKKQNKDRLLQKWGLDREKAIVLISAGAFGVTNLVEVCKSLIRCCPSTQFIVVCGRNRKLYQQMMTVQQSEKGCLVPLPFVNEMDELMQMADLFITKAGGLSVTEALASEVPMVLFNSLPGQEAENAKYLVQLGVAKSVQTDEQLIIATTTLLANPHILSSMKARLAQLPFTKSASLAIASRVRNACVSGVPYRKNSYANKPVISTIIQQ